MADIPKQCMASTHIQQIQDTLANFSTFVIEMESIMSIVLKDVFLSVAGNSLHLTIAQVHYDINVPTPAHQNNSYFQRQQKNDGQMV